MYPIKLRSANSNQHSGMEGTKTGGRVGMEQTCIMHTNSETCLRNLYWKLQLKDLFWKSRSRGEDNIKTYFRII